MDMRIGEILDLANFNVRKKVSLKTARGPGRDVFVVRRFPNNLADAVWQG
jgi:hypothetical protein